ncbi:cysteine-rich motor neuron 1 protein isoform X2, partial [Clarias magur]
VSGASDAGVEDEQCPLSSGCNLVSGECVCESKRSCLISFTFPNLEACAEGRKTEATRHEKRHRDRHREKFVGPSDPACVFSGCNLTTKGCECASQSCHPHFTYANRSQCQLAAVELKCAGITCPTPPGPECPLDSVLTSSYTPPGGCCPTIPPQCTCDQCPPQPECHNGHKAVIISEASGAPGNCCHSYKCEKVSPRCVHNGTEFTEGDVYRMDSCWVCQCRGGISFCSKAECAALDCENFYIPDGECCPVCTEPSYETVSPLLCPPLENCSLSEHDCPFGFLQDNNGCLLCQCLGNDSCPNLSSYCNKQCPMGYEKDDYGCEVCECSIPSECRPLTCRKTCPYGYVRNKHGCEMCRCIKCPPFTCDKQCNEGYKQNRKGCNICLCKVSEHSVSSTTSPPGRRDCLTANGQQFEEGESWHDGCRDCYCHAGREMCVLISCPAPSCTNPVLRQHQCCPSCDEELGSGVRPGGMDMVVCQAPGDQLYVEGDTWDLDECTRCTCRQGRVLCDTEVCPPLLCKTPTKAKGTCCHICQEDTLGSLLPVNSSQREYCISSDGDVLLAGDSWKPNACTSCICNNGTIQCFSQRCPAAKCKVPVLRKGQCCPQCLDSLGLPIGTTEKSRRRSPKEQNWPCSLGGISPIVTMTNYITSTSVPVMTTSKPESEVSDTITISHSEEWITMQTLVPVTGGSSLTEDVPTEMEMSLIYQSVAWILAALLMSIVLFFIVAFLINKKKNCIQMSCYDAPKKTVILKKHVNKSSVVYADPSKENKLQSVKNDCSMTFSPCASSPYGERINIPRAKLSNGHTRDQR